MSHSARPIVPSCGIIAHTYPIVLPDTSVHVRCGRAHGFTSPTAGLEHNVPSSLWALPQSRRGAPSLPQEGGAVRCWCLCTRSRVPPSQIAVAPAWVRGGVYRQLCAGGDLRGLCTCAGESAADTSAHGLAPDCSATDKRTRGTCPSAALPSGARCVRRPTLPRKRAPSRVKPASAPPEEPYGVLNLFWLPELTGRVVTMHACRCDQVTFDHHEADEDLDRRFQQPSTCIQELPTGNHRTGQRTGAATHSRRASVSSTPSLR